MGADATSSERSIQPRGFPVSAACKIASSAEGRRQELEETKSSIDQIAAILTSHDFDSSGHSAPDSIDFLKLSKQEIATVSACGNRPITFHLPAKMPALLGNRVHLSQVPGTFSDQCLNPPKIGQ